MSVRIAANAALRPSAAPASANNTLSVTICRTSRAGLAPTAVRSAISRNRASPRTSSRLATFVHAMRSRKPTAPIKIQSAGRTLPRISSSTVTAKAVNFIDSG